MPDAAGSPDPERGEAPGRREAQLPKLTWPRIRLNVFLFALTVWSVFDTGALEEPGPYRLLAGWKFAVPLLAILLAHEFGHYFASRFHRVPASLPYFIPLPRVGFLGTMGAVISMRDRIRSRNALLDIGASGPLAGLVVAIPVLFWGIAHSPVVPASVFGGAYFQEGQSLLYAGIKWLVHGSIPPDHDVNLHPAAWAGWAGLLLTLINLLPFGQLDGGHVAYALFGEKQNRFAPWFRRALLPLFALNLAKFLIPALTKPDKWHVATAVGNSLFWLEWFVVLGLLARFSGRDHPPFEPGPLSGWRRAVAWFTLAIFVALFMPTPIARVIP
jgi:membrane-associated protease RseP (regulator of RpoE activity)